MIGAGRKFAFEGTFKRKSPAAFADKIGIPLGWVVVHHDHIPEKANRRKAHGEWFELTTDRGTIYRMIRFSPNLAKAKPDKPGVIVIDWIGWLDLHNRDEDVNGPIALTVRRVPFWKRPWAYLKHPDPAVRLSGCLGWASVILGLIALVLAFSALPYCWIGEHVGSLGPPIVGSCEAGEF